MTTDLTVGTFTPSFLIEIARHDGRFAAAGLNVVERLVSSSPQQFQSLADGDYDVVFTNPDNVIAYQFLSDNPLGRSLDLRVFAGIDRGLGLGLFRGAHVGPEQRAGRLGVDVATSGFAFVAYEILSRHGFDLAKMSVESLGATPRRADALIEGTCDFTVLNAGNDERAAARGCVRVDSVVSIGPYLGSVLTALRTADLERVSAQNRFREVLADTITSVLSGFRDDDVLAALQPLLGLDDRGARQHLRCIKDPTTGLVPGGTVDAAAISTLVALRQRHRPSEELGAVLASLESVVDADVLR